VRVYARQEDDMSHRKMGAPLTEDQVHERLVAMLKDKYRDSVDLMAMDLNIDKYYLKMLLKKQRTAPRWLLDKLGVVIHRYTVIEFYAT
jgi:hypothetical protein